jgi:hypothetical protein
MLAVAPSPMESSATTVATPITMPRMVNTERILFARKARKAIFRFSENNMFISPSSVIARAVLSRPTLAPHASAVSNLEISLGLLRRKEQERSSQ